MYIYPFQYSDAQGQEHTTLQNDGSILKVAIRGVEFAGSDFDSLSPVHDAPQEQLSLFSFNRDRLCDCTLKCIMSIEVYDGVAIVFCPLEVKLILGRQLPNGALDREELQLELECMNRRFSGSGASGWFEDELLEIQSELPAGVYLRACINCLYSDYSPYGHGAFGCMRCFRNAKSEYLQIRTKDDMLNFGHSPDRVVQETYLCPEFKRRVPGTGYRG